MDDRRLVKLSKYLAKHLRHQPERLGLQLEPGGWVGVDKLLRACREAGVTISRPELDEVVARNDKRRFSFDADGEKIRANQGHSVDVDLQLQPATPPAVLYHGTNVRALDAIMRDGLVPMGRHHVHLSADVQTARRTGARRGAPVVLRVDVQALQDAGATFYRSDNDVWLVDAVPPEHLAVER